MKVAFVVQRYAQGVSGGAEAHCQKVAEHMAKHWQVEILTTCAKDYISWRNHYPEGQFECNQVLVRRFEVDHPRKIDFFNRCYDYLTSLENWYYDDLVLKEKITQKEPSSLNVSPDYLGLKEITQGLDIECKKMLGVCPSLVEETLVKKTQKKVSKKSWKNFFLNCELGLIKWLVQRLWMKEQGPYSSSLLDYLKANKNNYDIFFFFTYGYATTFYGLPIVKDKAALIPTIHDDPCLKFSIYDKLMNKPKFILFNTHEEENLALERFPWLKRTAKTLVGVGVDLPKNFELIPFREKFSIQDPYILYVGRIEEFKGCSELFKYFINFKKENPSTLKLVLIGTQIMTIPRHDDIIHLGFIKEEDKFAAIQHSEAIVVPSPYESLSISLLEAWNLSKAVLVNGKCLVLLGQCERSRGGLIYMNEVSFQEALLKLLGDAKLSKKLGLAGKEYVLTHYDWKIIEKKYLEIGNYFTQGRLI